MAEQELPYIELPRALVENICAKKDVRYCLNAPYLDLREPDDPRMVGTDGHMLLAAAVVVHGDVVGGLLSLEAIRRVRKKAGKLNCAPLYFERDMCVSGDQMFRRPDFDTDFTYPDWRKIVPKTTRKTPDISFNADYFKKMQDALLPQTMQRQCTMFLGRKKCGKGTAIDPTRAIVVKTYDGDDDRVDALIMPMRFD